MTSAAKEFIIARRLRVSINAPDPVQRARLRRIIAETGHECVDTLDAADVVLSDGDCPVIEKRICITLGGSDHDHAGLLAHDADAGQIDAALRAVAAGLIVRSPAAAEPGFAAMRESSLRALLTPREIEVLSAMGEGLSNKVIARRLNISLHTVKFHVESLFKKLGVRTRTEAVTRASEHRRGETVEL